MPVAVFTDSTACVPDQLAAQWGINVVQVQIHVGDRTDDENRFERGEIIDLLRSGAEVSTSPPDQGAFFWAYQEAVSQGADAIVSLHISGKLSATVQAARAAAQQVRVPVHVLDSSTTGMSLGFAALSAARAAAAGAHPRRAIEAAERRLHGSAEFIYVDTLEFLRRGGRIGAAAATVGTALSLKPLITIRGGEVAPLARVPGTKRALSKLADTTVEFAGTRAVDVAIASASPSQREMAMVQQLRERLPDLREIILVEGSAVIGAHTGPGALGITVSPA